MKTLVNKIANYLIIGSIGLIVITFLISLAIVWYSSLCYIVKNGLCMDAGATSMFVLTTVFCLFVLGVILKEITR